MDLLSPFDQMQSAVLQQDPLEGTQHGQHLRTAVILRTIQVLVLIVRVVTPTPLPPPHKVHILVGREAIHPSQILLLPTQLLLDLVASHTDLMQFLGVEHTGTVLCQQEDVVRAVYHQEVLN